MGTMQYEIAPWKTAKISNNFMFRLVMEKPELCKTLVERILDIKINKIVYLEPEKSIEAKLTSKGIRLDIYIEDDKGVAYDVELQADSSDKTALGKRTRYYQSLMDSEALKKGTLYSQLRKSVIIFICTFDPFDRNLGKYTFNSICQEDITLDLNDAMTKIFLNTVGDKHRLSTDLVRLMEYINDGKPTDEYTEKLDEMVSRLREDDGKEALYMTYQQTILEAEEKGKQKGKIEGRIDSYREMLKAGLITMEQVIASGMLSKDELALLQH